MMLKLNLTNILYAIIARGTSMLDAESATSIRLLIVFSRLS